MADHAPAGEVDAARISAFANGSYHADREAFLDSLHRWLMLVVIVCGTSALFEVTPKGLRQVVTALAALAGTFDLVWDLSVRARKHGYLRRLYFETAADLAAGAVMPSDAEAVMLRAAADEEPPYQAAHAIAENWATMAVLGGNGPPPCRIGWVARLLRHVLRFSDRSFSAPCIAT